MDARYTSGNSSSVPSLCSRDQPDRKLGVLRRQTQQSTDSAISVSLEDIDDDALSTASSSLSSHLSPLQLYATPITASCDVISGHVTPADRLRRGMTLSGDDLYPARMRTALSTTNIDDADLSRPKRRIYNALSRPSDDDITKHRDEPSEPMMETGSERPEGRQEMGVSVNRELEKRWRPNTVIQRHKDQESDRSTSDDYGSDYEDGGYEFRWRDDSASTSSPRRRGVRQRRSYYVSRRRRDVRRSQSDSVRVTGKHRTAHNAQI